MRNNLSISDNQSTSSRIVNEVLDFEGGSVDEDLPEGNAVPDPNDLVGPGIESLLSRIFSAFLLYQCRQMYRFCSSLVWNYTTNMFSPVP